VKHGLPRDSVDLCYQVQVRGKARLTQRLGELSPERLPDIEAELLKALGL
jgi:mRNA-degrading endonuclease toxin of MazEF toxin-antitoxin module